MCPLVLLDEDAYPDPDGRLSSHRQFLENAAELGVESVVVITGGLPSGSRDLKGQRLRIQEELSLLIPLAKAVGVRLASNRSIRWYADTVRSFQPSQKQTKSWIAWMPMKPWGSLSTVMHCGGILRWKNKSNAQARDCLIFMSQTGCPKPGMRLDRGMPGDGIIDNRLIRVDGKSRFQGSVEVEILSEFNWWKQDPKLSCKALLNLCQILTTEFPIAKVADFIELNLRFQISGKKQFLQERLTSA